MRSLLAAVMLFTRIPLWRISAGRNITAQDCAAALKWWPVTGLLTGAVMISVMTALHCVMPLHIAVIAAVAARVIFTGAMHEDGLADFCDGFGGGRDREQILSIMKDSHIGTYGTIGLLFYFILLPVQILSLSGVTGTGGLCCLIISAECISRASALWIAGTLPYARSAAQSKTGFVYDRPSSSAMAAMSLFAVIPLALSGEPLFFLMLPLPAAAIFAMRGYLKYKTGGYTGDCCGASVLIIEQLAYAGFIIAAKLWM